LNFSKWLGSYCWA